MTVVPRGLLWRRLYGAVAIAMALALWAKEQMPAHKVRAHISPFCAVGATAAARWDSLRRWSRDIRAGLLFGAVRASPPWWTHRQVARRAVETILALAPGTSLGEPLLAQVACGAERIR